MNKKLKCLIIDDEEMATKVIESHLSHIEEMEIVGIFHSGVEAFLALDKMEVDVLFLDIQMPKMTGLALLKTLKNPPLTVLTTAHRDYALEGFDLDVVDYLLKPIGLDRFLQTISKIRRLLQSQVSKPVDTNTESPKDHLFIKANRSFVKLFFRDIFYVEAVKNHVKIVCRQGVYLSLISISEFFKQLPTEHFLRVHRSFIIHLQHIETFNNYCIHIQNSEIPIGRSYKEEVRKVLQNSLSS